MEQSLRQGRTILNSVKSSKKKGASLEYQEEMNEEMNALISQLKKQREEMERK